MTTIEIQQGITLRCFTDGRFKQGLLTLQFIRPMCHGEAGLNALIPAVLLRGCEGCADMEAVTRYLEGLYGANISTMVRRNGDFQCTGLCLSFLEDRFAPEAVFAPLMAFTSRLLQKPLMTDSFIESEKQNLLSTIASQLNDKRSYAANRLLYHMGTEDAMGIPRLGTREDVECITPQAFRDHYRKVLTESPVELFYVGAMPPQAVAELAGKLFAGLERRGNTLQPQGPYRASDPCEASEAMEISQGKLGMGFLTGITVRDSDFPAMQLLNMVLGGGMTSKLFMNIREKQSLCYDISSTYFSTKGILTVNAGIDFDKEQEVRQQVLLQLDACKQGSISPQELESARQYLLSALRGLHDTPGSIENFYATGVIGQCPYTRDTYMAAVEALTAADLQRAAQGLRLQTVFFLKGVRK